MSLIWKCLQPIVGSLMRRLDDHVNEHLARLMGQLSIWHSQQSEALRQIELLDECLLREMARLQAQIVLLEANLSEAVNPPAAAPETAAEDQLRPRDFSQAA